MEKSHLRMGRNYMKRVYLDNAASAPLNKKVVKMLHNLGRLQGNPQGENGEAHWALNKMKWARWQVACAIGCDEDEVFFCSGATEANNLAKKLWNIVSDGRVHDSLRASKSVGMLDANDIEEADLVALFRRRELDKLSQECHNGIYSSEEERAKFAKDRLNEISDQTLLMSQGLMDIPDDIISAGNITYAMSYINNETGKCDGQNWLTSRVFLDLTATMGHMGVNLHLWPQIVGASFSGHKIGALQGVGVLYIKNTYIC